MKYLFALSLLIITQASIAQSGLPFKPKNSELEQLGKSAESFDQWIGHQSFSQDVIIREGKNNIKTYHYIQGSYSKGFIIRDGVCEEFLSGEHNMKYVSKSLSKKYELVEELADKRVFRSDRYIFTVSWEKPDKAIVRVSMI